MMPSRKHPDQPRRGNYLIPVCKASRQFYDTLQSVKLSFIRNGALYSCGSGPTLKASSPDLVVKIRVCLVIKQNS
jgi:hypothetical protein